MIGWWYAVTRAIDLRILWPACKRQARDLDHAKSAFAFHCFTDRGWKYLGKEEIIRRIDQLT